MSSIFPQKFQQKSIKVSNVHKLPISGTTLYLSAETHSEPSQAPKMNLFAKIVGSFTLTLLIIFLKCIILDVCRDPECISELF